MYKGKNKTKLQLIGLITGLVNGLFGSGGGTIAVPALVFILGLDQHKAHATAISIIFPLSLISSFVFQTWGFKFKNCRNSSFRWYYRQLYWCQELKEST